MVTALRMQIVVPIRKNNSYFMTNIFSIIVIFTFRALGVENPRGRAITITTVLVIVLFVSALFLIDQLRR